jgi:hypothetical protein
MVGPLGHVVAPLMTPPERLLELSRVLYVHPEEDLQDQDRLQWQRTASERQALPSVREGPSGRERCPWEPLESTGCFINNMIKTWSLMLCTPEENSAVPCGRCPVS